MSNQDEPDADEQFEKVKAGLGPDDKTSYASAQTGDEARKKAERVRREIHEDRKRNADA
jgi:hypothetical protein